MGMIQGWIGSQLRRPNGLLGRWIGNYMEKGNREANRWTVGLMNVEKGETVLEVGSGNGAAIEYICRETEAGYVCGLDLSDEMVRQATRRHKAAISSGKVEIAKGAAGALPYAASRFDKVFTVHTIYFWVDTEIGVAEMYRVLRPGGRLLVTFMDGAAMARLERAKNFRLFTPGEVENMLAAVGFHSVVRRQNGPFWCLEVQK